MGNGDNVGVEVRHTHVSGRSEVSIDLFLTFRYVVLAISVKSKNIDRFHTIHICVI